MKRNQSSDKPPGKKAQHTCFVVSEPEELMKFLVVQLPRKNRNNIKMLLKKRKVLVDGKAVGQFNYRLKPGQKVEISPAPVSGARRMPGVAIVYEDQDLIVVNKQAGLLSMATDKEKRQTVYSMLSSYVKEDNKENKIFIVHRLDRETSGLMMFARSREIQELLQESWKKTVSERSYLAVVSGRPDPPEGTVTSYLYESVALIVYSSQNPEKGQKAVTHYATLKSNESYALLQVNLETGRKNQIRVHMKDLGHPVIGDKKYGSDINPVRRLGLHAWVLAFSHPRTKEKMRFETAVPGSFLKLF